MEKKKEFFRKCDLFKKKKNKMVSEEKKNRKVKQSKKYVVVRW